MQSLINQAVNILQGGGLVGMPTETVYGLGADARNPEALRKIFLAKQRPIDHPLIVHISDAKQLSEWASEVSPLAWRLAEAFWPGPLTLIMPKAPHVLDLITGGQQTIGVRIPHHPIAQALLKSFGSGIAAPSANRFGRISPTTAAAVKEELGDAVDIILDGGPCEVGVESTIVDVSGEHPIILRPGIITADQIEAVIQETLATQKSNVPRVSGAMESHYAPSTPTKLLPTNKLEQLLAEIKPENLPVVLMVNRPTAVPYNEIESIVMPSDPLYYAHLLYQTLRALDKKQFKQIIIEDVPDSPEWAGVRDRLLKASFKGFVT
jgi:L-threonylcarbamoyladenylate synthase